MARPCVQWWNEWANRHSPTHITSVDASLHSVPSKAIVPYPVLPLALRTLTKQELLSKSAQEKSTVNRILSVERLKLSIENLEQNYGIETWDEEGRNERAIKIWMKDALLCANGMILCVETPEDHTLLDIKKGMIRQRSRIQSIIITKMI